MQFYIIIPAYNEAQYIEKTLQSLVYQTLLPKKVVVVNDNSTDETPKIVEKFTQKYAWITLVHTKATQQHLPGSKVIQAFNTGLATLDATYDFIVKADADIIFPPHYFEVVSKHFKSDKNIGMVGGKAYIYKENKWVLENISNQEHVRGPFKAYRKACFLQINGLEPSIGWDTVDELKARFYNWKIKIDTSLHVKHLKPTGFTYTKNSKYKQGEAFYIMGYGFLISAIAITKLAIKKKSIALFLYSFIGYFKAQKDKKQLLVTEKQALFIKNYRWKLIKSKLFGEK